MNWEEIWNSIVNFFKTNVWGIIGFFSALAIGIVAIILILFIVRKVMAARGVDRMAIRFLSAALRLALAVVLVLILLSIIGVPITGLITAFSAAVLAIGMALKDFLANVASGIILIGSQKYKAGDYIRMTNSPNVEGFIVDINFLFVTLKTYDNTQITLPNSMVVNHPITNLSTYPERRVAITISVAPESDTKVVRETLIAVMKSCNVIHDDPAPLCRLKTMGDHSLDFFLTCYCDKADYWDAYFYIMDRGFDELKRAGVQFPFQQVEIIQKSAPVMEPSYDGLPMPTGKKARKVEAKKVSIDDIEEMDFRAIAQSIKDADDEKKRKKAAKAKEKEEQKAAKAKAKQKDKPEDEETKKDSQE